MEILILIIPILLAVIIKSFIISKRYTKLQAELDELRSTLDSDIVIQKEILKYCNALQQAQQMHTQAIEDLYVQRKESNKDFEVFKLQVSDGFCLIADHFESSAGINKFLTLNKNDDDDDKDKSN